MSGATKGSGTLGGGGGPPQSHGHNSSGPPPNLVRPQPVSERTLMESMAGLINEVGLVTQQHPGSNEEKENSIVWTKFEARKNLDFPLEGEGVNGSRTQSPPLLLTLGYHSGVQIWAIPASGEAVEVLSWRRQAVRLFQILPSPKVEGEVDEFQHHRPIVAVVEGSNSPSCANLLTFISLSSGEVLKSCKFSHPVCDLVANSLAIVVSFLDKILILNPCTLETRVTISSAGICTVPPAVNPIALGSTWLAYSERKFIPECASVGGVEAAGAQSYTATVLYAAKSLTKGLKGLGETVANSITGHRIPMQAESSPQTAVAEPGVVTIINLSQLPPGEFNLNSGSNGKSHSIIVAHFVAHITNPIVALSFDSSGVLLVTADKGGHDFHVFRIHPHPLSPTLGAVHHLYVLHRGDTVARVQDISFAPDSRWVAVSTMRGTTHIFPITPYGGSISVRTHTSSRVVNRLSRFHRTAGLDDAPTSGRNSPVSTFVGGPTNNCLTNVKSYEMLHMGCPYPNPRLPPFPHPVIVHPLAQLRQSFNVSSSPKSSPPIGKSKGFLNLEERIAVVSSFQSPRGWLSGTSPIVPHCDKRKKAPVEAVFVMTCHGTLIEYCLDPRPNSGIPKEKVSEDTPIELSVHAKAQWNFTRPSFTKDLNPPLGPNNMILNGTRASNHSALVGNSALGCASEDFHFKERLLGASENDESPDEKWLSQVEITTHAGPHRRLWMGPQFTFKVFNHNSTTTGNPGTMVDVETVEVNVTNRPAKSNPVNMPISSALLPVVIEGSSGSSLEQSPRFVDPYCDTESCAVSSESIIKESLADAMMENCAIGSRDTGGCQSLGSCDDLSSSSFGSTSVEVPSTPSFCIEANLPFPD